MYTKLNKSMLTNKNMIDSQAISISHNFNRLPTTMMTPMI